MPTEKMQLRKKKTRNMTENARKQKNHSKSVDSEKVNGKIIKGKMQH